MPMSFRARLSCIFYAKSCGRPMPMGKIFSDITIVPQANPIGTAQSHFGELQGRFDLGSRTNFNREFPLIGLSERETLIDDLERYPVVEQLKRQLLHMALGADLMLDLHCDDESVQYTYVDEAFWPEAADLASALDMEAVFLADGESSAFEEAVGYAWKHETAEKAKRLPGRLAVTVELRGTRDVYPDMARKDAEGLWRFLVARGAVGGAAATIEPYRGKVTPLDNIEMIRAPQAGAVLFSSRHRRYRRCRRSLGDDHHRTGHGGWCDRYPCAAGRAGRHAHLATLCPPPRQPDEDRLRRAHQGGA